MTLVGAIPFEEAVLLTEMLEIGHLPIALEPAPAGDRWMSGVAKPVPH